jgi:hypothetical protein
MYLKNTAYNSSLDTSWAASFSMYGDGDMGTPGRAWDDTTTIAISDELIIPDQFILYPAYPNPFNPKTIINFNIGIETLRSTSLQIYDISGRMVDILVDGRIEMGIHEITWNASNQPSGVYFAHLQIESFHQTIKLVLLK